MESAAVRRGSAFRPSAAAPLSASAADSADVVNLRGRQYVMVRRRLQELRKDHPDWRIVTELIREDAESATFKATVYDEHGEIRATGHDRAYGEQCVALAETGAIGRAISIAGYGSDDLLERVMESSG